jgi:hypothetical protein
MNVELGKNYITTVEVLGMCPKGSKVKPSSRGEGTTRTLVMGKSGETCLFSMLNGGGVFLKDTEVKLIT